ncbi:hypothetical protein [Pleionea sp. CnH1-48]|uniref:hypothetical protein n=1 Tax=Pleionea sp. CnH1-48 TaxID=2954494 RepID=UPI0020974854|nr:hypothetical protein [Pleionea sp. CnH1-48]MCO7224753.1 hypothetical protein [Pleionea sp. CnH1-48]
MRLLIFILLFLSFSASASVYYQGKFYLDCQSCTTTEHFKARAKNHFETVFPQNQYLITPEKTYIVSSIQERQVTAKTIRIQRKIAMLPGLREGASQLQITVKVAANDSWTNFLVDEYISNHYDFSLIDFGTIARVWNKIYLHDKNIMWEGTPNFGGAIEPFINSELSSLGFNPFHFVNTPLAVEAVTTDGYYVTLFQKSPVKESPSWEVFSVQKGNLYLDSSGNQLGGLSSEPPNATCFTSLWKEICRSRSENTVYGGILVRENTNKIADDGGGAKVSGCPTGAKNCKRN